MKYLSYVYQRDMAIQRLPEYVINKLKAGEIVDRPSSILKELIENSLDAKANTVTIDIQEGGKKLLSVEDDGLGIELSDMDMVLERYATSKIKTDEDIYKLTSYGFRGEALASIAEVAKITLLSKTEYSEIGTKLTKRGGEVVMNHVPVPFDHGTIVTVEDLFYNIPARLKFLKSPQTEFYYCYNHFVDTALYHHHKSFVFKKNGKQLFDLPSTRSLTERIGALYKKDRSKNLKEISYQEDSYVLSGYVSDASLRFGSGENIKIYVNGRPVHDKIIRKALMDGYARQITPGEYPLVVLMLDVQSDLVDVNIHPGKLQVKFLDPQKIYKVVFDAVQKTLGENKIGSVPIPDQSSQISQPKSFFNTSSFAESSPQSQNMFSGQSLRDRENTSGEGILSFGQSFDAEEVGSKTFHQDDIGDYQILGQLRNRYIALQSNDALYYVDQHALAERITFEKIKQEYATNSEDSGNKSGLQSENLLQPLKYDVTNIPDLDQKIEELNVLGFEISLLDQNKIVVYVIPKIFVTYPVELEKLFNHVFYQDHISFDHILDGIIATKACKTSIKAGHKLSYQQMSQLVQDGFQYIPGMFVCQHGRPFFVKIDKGDVDKLFDR